jgi:hypothetical protein
VQKQEQFLYFFTFFRAFLAICPIKAAHFGPRKSHAVPGAPGSMAFCLIFISNFLF